MGRISTIQQQQQTSQLIVDLNLLPFLSFSFFLIDNQQDCNSYPLELLSHSSLQHTKKDCKACAFVFLFSNTKHKCHIKSVFLTLLYYICKKKINIQTSSTINSQFIVRCKQSVVHSLQSLVCSLYSVVRSRQSVVISL